MMMAAGGVPAPLEARGREPPLFFFFLDLLPRWEKGFPSGTWLPWRGRGESPSEIGSVSLSLSVSAFLILPFHRFYIHGDPQLRLGCPLDIISIRKLDFLQRKKGINRLTGCPRGSGARLPVSWAPRALSHVDSSSKK